MAEISIQPIGFFHGPRFSKASIPRQGHLSDQEGFIQFEKGFDHSLGLTGLERMSHVWVLYYFHEARADAKPLVRPPRAPDRLVGVYATRSPYRPSKIGMTLARIQKIESHRLYVAGVDLLNQTPILDLKPYVPDSDQAENPQIGWIQNIKSWTYTLSPRADEQVRWLFRNGLSEIYDVLEAQLGTSLLQESRKRLKYLSDNQAVLSYRTWRIYLAVTIDRHQCQVEEVGSGYTSEDLQSSEDPYQDKALHRHFLKIFLGR